MDAVKMDYGVAWRLISKRGLVPDVSGMDAADFEDARLMELLVRYRALRLEMDAIVDQIRQRATNGSNP